MQLKPRILIVIPARGGSKGVPRKNLSPMAGIPLLSYSIRTARSVLWEARIVVSTDDEEIASIARREGAHVIMRDPSLSSDAITLDPVIFHAVQSEESQGRSYDLILTMQTTSPLLRPATINRIITRLAANEADTIITAVNDAHLAWEMTDGMLFPAYKKRLNRQLLPRRFRETGGVIATYRSWISPSSRFGPRVALEIIDEIEGLDLDTPEDWLFAEAALGRRRMAFITIGNELNGLGHVMRVRSLLECLHGHPTLVLCDPAQTLAIDFLRESFQRVEICERNKMLERIVQWGAQVVVHDELETDPLHIAAERDAGLRIVLFEDDGPSKEMAHLVFNALFASYRSQPEKGWYFGPEVYDLREEFRHAERAGFNEKPRRILITFGGTDPSGALDIALQRLKPEAIFLMTDGVFDPATSGAVIAAGNPTKKVEINTICFHDQIGEQICKQIAADNNGSYRYVPPPSGLQHFDIDDMYSATFVGVHHAKAGQYWAAFHDVSGSFVLTQGNWPQLTVRVGAKSLDCDGEDFARVHMGSAFLNTSKNPEFVLATTSLSGSTAIVS